MDGWARDDWIKQEWTVCQNNKGEWEEGRMWGVGWGGGRRWKWANTQVEKEKMCDTSVFRFTLRTKKINVQRSMAVWAVSKRTTVRTYCHWCIKCCKGPGHRWVVSAHLESRQRHKECCQVCWWNARVAGCQTFCSFFFDPTRHFRKLCS